MNKDDFYFLGKITKGFGYKSELIFWFDVDDLSEYEDISNVFIDINGDLIPYTIRKITFRQNNTAIVELDEIDNQEKALQLINCELYMPLSDLPELEGNRFYYHEIIGYKLFDKEIGEIGEITEVIDQTAQAVIVAKNDDNEILFPVADDLIVEVDRKEKIIYVKTPDGLLDIYT